MLQYKDIKGLVPAIVQDSETGKILMLGFMNQEAFDKTIESKKATFYSRSRNTLWTKGETSGNTLDVKDILVDCDKDSVLLKVKPNGPTCHKGYESCFFSLLKDGSLEIIEDRKFDPAEVYGDKNA